MYEGDIYDSSGKKIGHLGNGGKGWAIVFVFIIVVFGFFGIMRWGKKKWNARDDFRAKVVVEHTLTAWDGDRSFQCTIPVGTEVSVVNSDRGSCEIYVLGENLKCPKSARIDKYAFHQFFTLCEKLEKMPD